MGDSQGGGGWKGKQGLRAEALTLGLMSLGL